jgi:hypothetical protein
MRRRCCSEKLAVTEEVTMERKVNHFVRDALVVASCYAALIAAAWVALGFGGAMIAATGAGALIALGLPLAFIYYEEWELFHPHGRAGH